MTLLSGSMNRVLFRMLCEPITHFVIAGVFLFLASRIYQHETNLYRIVLTPQHVAKIANDYALQFGAQPDPQILSALVERDIHDEILFRQGLALKLDQEDEIVRRRVIEKAQFLLQALSAPREPTSAQLQAYYDAHADRYFAPARATFTHIYFATGPGGDSAAIARARAVLETLSNATVRAPDRGDPFPDLYDFSAYEPDQVSRLFGRTPFATAVFTQPAGHWSGPVRSGYGWHLIFVDARQDSVFPPLAAVRDRVRADYLQDAQANADKSRFDELAERFTVVRETSAP